MIIFLLSASFSNSPIHSYLFQDKHHPIHISSSSTLKSEMIEERRGAPYGILLAVVVVVLIGIPMFLGDGGEAVTEFIAELLSPLGLLLLPIVLLLLIQYLSSDSGSFVSNIFSTGEPNSIHRASGSPVGVGLVLLLVLFLLYNKFSIFGGDEDSDE